MKREDLENHEWVLQQCEATNYLISVPAWVIVNIVEDRSGARFRTILSHIKGTYGHFAYRKADVVSVASWILAQEEKQDGFIADLRERWKTENAAFQDACREAPLLEKLSNEQLLQEFEKFCTAYEEQWALPLISDAWNLHAEHLLIERLAEVVGREQLATHLPILTAPVDASFAAREEEELLQIIVDLPPGLSKAEILTAVGDQLEAHARKYHWILNSYLKARNADAAHFTERLAEFAKKNPREELSRIRSQPQEAREKKRALEQSLNLPEDIVRMLRLTEQFAIWQDTRKRNNLIGDHYMDLFLAELCRRNGWKREDCAGITYKHYADALNGKITLETAKEWSGESFIIWSEDSIDIHTGADAAECQRFVEHSDDGVSDIRGTCASQGRAEGRVRVIKETKDIPKMEKGDILVSGMTRPELVPAMKLAAAVVTDEGGMTSHAAIVSRELGIPCLVGTRVATKVLKDGEFVEVNADHGSVRRIQL